MSWTYASPEPAEHPSGWAVGWTAFAGVMMVIQGTWWVIAGLVALFNDEFFVTTPNYVFRFDLTTWGVIHLAVGVLILAAGVALFSGVVWARTVGVLMAGVGLVAGFAWMPYYPLWGILLVVISIAVIWSLTVHGRDIEDLRTS
jgi:hypothetical protein